MKGNSLTYFFVTELCSISNESKSSLFLTIDLEFLHPVVMTYFLKIALYYMYSIIKIKYLLPLYSDYSSCLKLLILNRFYI